MQVPGTINIMYSCSSGPCNTCGLPAPGVLNQQMLVFTSSHVDLPTACPRRSLLLQHALQPCVLLQALTPMMYISSECSTHSKDSRHHCCITFSEACFRISAFHASILLFRATSGIRSSSFSGVLVSGSIASDSKILHGQLSWSDPPAH